MKTTNPEPKGTATAAASWNNVDQGLAIACAGATFRPAAREILLDSIADFLNSRGRKLGTLTLRELAEITRGAAAAHARTLLRVYETEKHR